MKKWNQPPERVWPSKDVVKVKEPEQIPLPPTVQPSFALRCVQCSGSADTLFEGSSYCQTCLKEKLRLGR